MDGTRSLLKHLLEQGLPKTAISAHLGISRRLVYHLIETGQLERDLSEPLTRRRESAAAKLEPYKPIITTRLDTYLSALLIQARRACFGTGGDS